MSPTAIFHLVSHKSVKFSIPLVLFCPERRYSSTVRFYRRNLQMNSPWSLNAGLGVPFMSDVLKRLFDLPIIEVNNLTLIR